MSTDSLFSHNLTKSLPLAERQRPDSLDGFVGQEKLVGEDSTIRRLIENDNLISMVFWGPPGSGKTTLAKIIANTTKSKFITMSAVSSGVKELRAIVEQAKNDKELHSINTVLFIDEIHRWNKSQQDSLLPHLEQGVITLIGATTENPSFELNNALLSRCQVFVFEQLDETTIRTIVERAAEALKPEIVDSVVAMADGDARVALNTIEMLQKIYPNLADITQEQAKDSIKKIALRYDKHDDFHHNTISALHKTMRASDVDAALYWCGRMLFAGEDPLYVMRRIVEFASEDIGNADPQALVISNAAFQTCHTLGMPECQYAVFQAVAYCANAPKSRAVYNAAHMVQDDIMNHPDAPVPMHLRNAPTGLMKDLGYGAKTGESNLPEQLSNKQYYSE